MQKGLFRLLLLGVLPLVFVFFIFSRWYRPPVGVMEVNYPWPGTQSDSIPSFGKQYYAVPKDIIWRDYVIDDQKVYNEAKFMVIRKQTRQMQADSSYGIRIIYTDKTSFNDYMRFLNLSAEEGRFYWRRNDSRYLKGFILNDTLWMFTKELVIYGEYEPYTPLSYR